MNNGFQNERYFIELFNNKYLYELDNNSIHQEQVQEFKKYLSDIGVPYKIADKYFSYHYGYMLKEDGKRDFSKLLSSIEYKNYINLILIYLMNILIKLKLLLI